MSSFVNRELAVLHAIDAAIATEKRPDYAAFLRDAKEGHQTALGQVMALRRLEGASASGSPGLKGALSSLQIHLTQLVGATLTFRAMRAVESHLVSLYEAEHANAAGLKRDALAGIIARAKQRVCLLTAHIVRGDGASAEEQADLPRPLGDYFATEVAQACMRCLVDRPGALPAIRRSDPETYICAACHGEVLASFPADLASQMPSWPDAARRDRVVEKALSKPSRQTAKMRVHTVLAGQAPILPPPRRGFVPSPAPRSASAAAKGTTSPALTLDLALDAATSAEAAYSRDLFDGRSLQKIW